MLADMQATDEEIGESIEEVTEVVVIEGCRAPKYHIDHVKSIKID